MAEPVTAGGARTPAGHLVPPEPATSSPASPVGLTGST